MLNLVYKKYKYNKQIQNSGPPLWDEIGLFVTLFIKTLLEMRENLQLL